MHQTEPSQLSLHYSFRSTGTALRVYRAQTVEQVSFGVGGSFEWSDDGKGYGLKLIEVRQGELLEGSTERHATSGIYEFSVTTEGATEKSTVEISI